jgi:glycerol-3-phosphate cytidylyltransferase
MKIGFNCSTFDLFHAGHVTMLKEEKRFCDYLIVAIQTDPTIDRPTTKNKPVQSIYERFSQVSACKYVDEVLVYSTEEDLMNMLKTQHINIRFLGDEYKTKPFTGKQWCLDNGVELHYHLREHPYSSSALRKRVYEAEVLRMSVANTSIAITTTSGFNGTSAVDLSNVTRSYQSIPSRDLGYTK